MSLEHQEARSQSTELQPTIEVPRSKSGRVKWGVLAQDSELLESSVLQQVQTVMADGTNFSHTNLVNAKRSPSGYWMDEERIRVEARKVLEEETKLTASNLPKAGYSSLGQAIKKYYPGSWNQLRTDLGIPSRYKPRGYWTTENIVKEAQEFYQQKSDLSFGLLQTGRKSGLAGAITKSYPGGLVQLKVDLNIPASQRPRGYFNDPSNIEAEARKIVDETGGLSTKAVRERGLDVSFRKYPGGIKALQQNLGIELTRKPHNFWKDTSNIENELQEMLNEHGTLSEELLRRSKRNDLAHAIQKYYPGGWYGVYQKFGIKVDRVARNTWSQEEIERQATEYYQSHGFISEVALRKTGHGGLASAMRNYPGRWQGLRAFLGITAKNEKEISPAEANEELSKLLEEQP